MVSQTWLRLNQILSLKCVACPCVPTGVCDPYLLRRKASKLTMLRFSQLASNSSKEQRGSGAQETPPLHKVTGSRLVLLIDPLSGAR